MRSAPLDDVVGMHEQLVKVERSHMSAVALVPPGMHRVRPKGEGKVSKRNLKHRERKRSEGGGRGAAAAPDAGEKYGDEKKAADRSKKESNTASMSVLSFRPRGVGRSGHQKPRLQLEEKASSNQTERKPESK